MASYILRGSAFITGAARGIGQSAALAFTRNGIEKLALTDVNEDNLKETKDLVNAQSPDVQVLTRLMDVRDRKQVAETLDYFASEFGRIDIAVNNAGISDSGKMSHETSDEEIEKVFSVNLMGVYRCQIEELRIMMGQEDLGPRLGRGCIVNVSSMYGIVAPGPNFPHTAYATAKHAVIGLTKSDANNYGEHQIRINAICPGFVATPLLGKGGEKGPDNPLQPLINRTASKRLCEPEEIADSIVCIASSMNSYMQGSSVIIDGGFTAN